MKARSFQLGLVLFGLFFVSQPSYADGVFIPPAKKKIPDIPVQRALVKYHQGTQALIVESTLDGEGGDYGWVIPVPNQPTKFDKVSPGLLKTLTLQIQPQIHHVERYQKVWGIRVEIIFAILIMMTCFCFMRSGLEAGIVSLTVFVFFMVLIPSFTSYRSGQGASSRTNPAINITSSEIVGDYEVFVLDVQNSSVLNAWLENQGLSKFPPEALQIIEDYISNDWLFVVAKLRTILDGIATPHPILLEFETDQPVYPMRLTAIPGSAVYLELFVVGDGEASTDNYPIQKDYCNFFDYGKIRWSRFGLSDGQTGFIPRKIFDPYMEIAHSDASKVMWDGCVVTKFSGTVSSSEMAQDMLFQFKPAIPSRAELYSPVGKFNKAYSVVIEVIMIGSILLTLYYFLRKSLGTEVSIIKLFVILLIFCAAGVAWSNAKIGETTEARTVKGFRHHDFQHSLGEVFYDPSNNFSNGSEFVDLLQKNGIDNPFTGDPIIIEDSPGNLMVEKTENGFKLKMCLENGSLYTLLP